VPHLFVHYDEAAVAHLFRVAAGLDSMVVGESQILGQVRVALQRGQEQATTGPVLNALFQQSLRVGKRGHAETGIDSAGRTVVSAALDHVERSAGPLTGRRASSSAPAPCRARRRHPALPRRHRHHRRQPHARARRAARRRRGRPDRRLGAAARGARGRRRGALRHRLHRPRHRGGLGRGRGAAQGSERPYAIVDLALPHDVDPAVASLPGVHHVGLATLVEHLASGPVADDVRAVRAIVGEEVSAFLSVRAAARVTPTVVALRSMATDVVEREIERLDARLPGLDDRTRAELAQTVRRVADKLLHSPTVRMKELADTPGGVDYAGALADLFRLDPAAVEAVTTATTAPEDTGGAP
jgi:glutamyl-tRNA reductase